LQRKPRKLLVKARDCGGVGQLSKRFAGFGHAARKCKEQHFDLTLGAAFAESSRTQTAHTRIAVVQTARKQFIRSVSGLLCD
jgi:hypothetical protein